MMPAGITGDIETRAIAVLKAAFGKHPTNMALRTVLTKVSFDAGKKAEGEPREMVKTDPKTLGPRLQLATFPAGNDKRDEAEALLHESLTAVDEQDRTPMKLALAEFLAAKRSKDKAIAELEGLVKAEPRTYELRFVLGSLYAVNGDLAKAKEVFQAIVKDDDLGPQGLGGRTKLAGIVLADSLIGEVLKENASDMDALSLRG